MLRKIIAAALCSAMLLTSGCSSRPQIESVDGWYATWCAATQTASADQLPRTNVLSGNTLRQQVKVSIGGDRIRLTFSNEFGGGTLKLESVHIAKLTSPGSPTIDLSTDTAVTFSGSGSVSIAPGKTVTSDDIAFSFEPLELLAVTIKFGSVPDTVTCHQDANCTSWSVEGDHVSDETFSKMELSSSWYFLSRVDTWAEAGTEVAVCFGDALTDGKLSTYNGFNSWPECLSQMMQDGATTKHISVVNSGSSGDVMTQHGTLQAAEERLKRDVLDIPGVHSVILLIGTDDIASAQYDTSSEIIDRLKALAEDCHSVGITVYAGTLTPFEGDNIYYSELHEKIRQSVNAFILSEESGFDGVIDFSTILCRAENPSRLQSIYDSGDGLVPNAKGYDAMARVAAETLRLRDITME